MEDRAVIRATELTGRAVVDLDCAEKVGRIDRIVLDTETRQVAAFVVSRGAPLARERMHVTVPASAVHAIGPDALTIHRAQETDASVLDRIEALPRASDLIGRKVVSRGGRFLGKIGDVLISRADGRIVGYTLGAHDVLNKIEQLFRRDKKQEPYLRADAELRTGKDLVVAPDDAVSDRWSSDEPGPTEFTYELSRTDNERRGIEPGAPLAPGTTIRRAD
jgi:sporulation protein YlmC with PRC-barrel domain